MTKNRNRLVVSVTLPKELVADMDKLIQILRESGEKTNRSIVIETALGFMFQDLSKIADKTRKDIAKAKKKEEC